MLGNEIKGVLLFHYFLEHICDYKMFLFRCLYVANLCGGRMCYCLGVGYVQCDCVGWDVGGGLWVVGVSCVVLFYMYAYLL